MFNVIQEINGLAVVLGTLALSLVGGLWFTVVWGKAYAYALGKENAPSGNGVAVLKEDGIGSAGNGRNVNHTKQHMNPSTSKEKPALRFILGPLVCGLVTTVAMAVLFYAFEIETLADALIFGGIVGAGLLAATTVNTGINPNIPRPLVYGLVSGSYFFLSGLIVSIILVAMS
ncbi:DUF1761 domain-containing protein [Paenibacillus sp. FSL E2-0178]|uniref:DUF1761 domain-containing protein n=1 Tax=Paenibacillus sp. FSL E2-0178 TaxID=2921361 RepID=UPI003158313D